MQKMSRLLNIVINISDKNEGVTKYIQKRFRQCNMNDFTSRGYYEIEEHRLSSLLCPDYEALKD